MFTPEVKPTTLFHPEAYPVLRHRDDILPHIAENKGIRLFTQGPLQVLRYLINSPEVFTTAYDMECRGLVFDTASGALLSRPFHKFHNHTSPETAAALLAAGPVRLDDKLDGSMLGGFLLNDTPLFHTKGGVSSQAKTALDSAPDRALALTRDAYARGYTPIFEWTSPDNRIVLLYPKPDFVLLALRHRETGLYDDHLADTLADTYTITRPTTLGMAETVEDLHAWSQRIAAMEGVEGVVAVGPDGRRGKIKTLAYLHVHKALSMLSHERHAFRAVVTELDDDLMPLLSSDKAAFFADYAARLRTRFLEIEAQAIALVDPLRDLAPAAAAAAIKRDHPALLHPLLFSALRTGSALDTLRSLLERRMGSQTSVEAAKTEFELPSWSPPTGMFLQD